MATAKNPFQVRRYARGPRIVNLDLERDPDAEARVDEALGSYPAIRPARAAELGLVGAVAPPPVAAACRRWLVREGLYQLPTLELVEALAEVLRGRSGLEICAGHGWLGEALGIRSVDSRVHERHSLLRDVQDATSRSCAPLPRVEDLDALRAVRRYRPQVVVGAYVTHARDITSRTGSPTGVDEDALRAVQSVETYALAGCRSTHARRPLLRRPHRTIEAPWLFGRGEEPRLWIWDFAR